MHRIQYHSGPIPVTDDPIKAWINAWVAAQGELARSAASAMDPQATESLQAMFAGHYRRMLALAMTAPAAGTAEQPGLAQAAARCQRAARTLAGHTATIAADAARRLVAELSRTDAAATPIVTLAALHALSIECGETAWIAAVHQDAYADAQAEWLASLVELQSEQRRLQDAAQAPGGPPP